MPELLIINPSVRPSKRKGASKMAKRRRTAKQVAATRKLVAMNKTRRRKPRVARASNPAPRKYRAVRRKVMSVSSYRRRGRGRSRNPIGTFSIGALTTLIKDGAIGAGGALSIDLALGFLPLPAMLIARKNADGGTNYLYYLTKAVAAVGLGAFGKKLIGRNAETMALGAMTVNMYDLFRTVMPAGIPLGYMSPARRASLNAYVNRRAANATATPQQITNSQTRNVTTLSGNPRMSAYVNR